MTITGMWNPDNNISSMSMATLGAKYLKTMTTAVSTG